MSIFKPKICGALFAFIVGLTSTAARADSVVMFNEIMYHPATNESELEWIELYNQLAVDVDISNWTITNGIGYKFPEGTIVPGGGYIVVAKSPSTLMALTGLTNVYGPFSGRLDNNSDTLELRNNNNRLMDVVKYGVEGDWPVAPDGCGPSLAKWRPDSASDDPQSWTASEQVGETPGKPNFPERIITIETTNIIKTDSTWTFFSGNVDNSWKFVDYDDSAWQSGGALFARNCSPPGETAAISTLFNTGLDTNGAALIPGTADGNYFISASAYSTPPPPQVPATVVANHPNWLPNDAASLWIGPIAQGTVSVPVGSYNYKTYFNLNGYDYTQAKVVFQVAVDNDLTNVALNGNLLGFSYSGFTAYSQQFTITNGFLPGTNTLEFFTYNSGTTPSPAGLRVKISGTAVKSLPVNTTLSSSSVYYFRNRFVFNDEPTNSRLIMRLLVDDGAVVYLNGSEIKRVNMPAGTITPSTFAATNVVNPTFTGWFDVDVSALNKGTNVLAVEVHQASNGTNDIIFGLEANIVTTNYPPAPPPTIAFNEISSVTNKQFSVELINYGNQAVNIENFVLARFGTYYQEFLIPSAFLQPGEIISFNKQEVGFGADPGDKVVLYVPEKKGVVDAIVAKSYPRARFPDGIGRWLKPSELTPGFSNKFVFNNDIVINEIMYHPPDLPAQPALYFTNKLVSMTNYWKYYQLGDTPDVNWFAKDYDDSNWDWGKGLFYANFSSLPAPRGTLLSISNETLPVITYYFRTPFLLTNPVGGISLTMNFVVDDGAIFYLNGREIFRYGMPSGEVSATTLASTNIGIPGIVGPIAIPSDFLVNGTNILAIEVHQYLPPPRSKDIAFGLELIASGFASPPLPERPSTEQWIELYNRGTNTVDLSGWKIDGVTAYDFPAGQTMPPDSYLVVAYDVDLMRAKYPGVNIVGPLKKSLSRSGGKIVIEDASGNPVNEVQYYDRFPFSEYADGFGSSLELIDPRADNSVPEAWAPSDESARSSWVTITYRGVATKEPANSPTYWKEFVMGIIDSGEIWLDNISVIEAPGISNRQLIQNGSFETGMNGWRIIGSHRHSEVIQEPGNTSNHILRLVADAPTEHIHNHAETTLAYGASITNGVEYEISYRAKWIAGCNKLNTRLYFNRLAKTTEIPRGDKYGTPGARNTAYVQNIGPTFSNLRHFPVVPYSTNNVTVSVDLSDPDGVASAVLKYSINGGVWWTSAMRLSNNITQYGYTITATGAIPAQSAGSIVQFYIEAKDRYGVKSSYPPTNSVRYRALYKVADDNQSLMKGLHPIRIIMTQSEAALLHSNTNMMSNELLGCTVVADEKTCYYNAGVHLQGSERNRVGFTVRLPAGQNLWGVHSGFSIDRSGGQSGLGGRHDEILIWRIIQKAGGLPDTYDDLCQVFSPRGSEDGSGYLRLAKYGDVFLDSSFKNGSDGEMYKLELIYYPTNTVLPGDPQSLKVPNPDLVLGTDIQDLGDDKENYRWTFLKENHVAKDNYAPMIALAKTFSLTGTNLEQQTKALMDVDEWTRAVALLSLIGSDDMYTYNNSHNLIIYFRPEDGRGMAFLWDLDYSFVASITKPFPGNGSANTYKIITTIPDNYRRYYHHLYDLTRFSGDSSFLTDWANRYARLLGQNWSGVVNYLVQRANFVKSYLPVSTPFAVFTNAGNLVVANNRLTLNGVAPISVEKIEINGLIQQVSWTSLTNWTLTLPAPSYTNLLLIRALGSDGNPVNGGVVSIVVTNQNIPPILPVVINEWMADNSAPGGYPEPSDNQFKDWFELYNPNNTAVNIGGYYLTDSLLVPNKYVIPSNTVIQAKGFLLVWADGSSNNILNGDLCVNFKLNKDGDIIALFSPDGSLQHSVSFSTQYQNVSMGLYPDGNTNQYYFMTNWTPRASNKLGMPQPPVLDYPNVSNGRLPIRISGQPHRAYVIEFNETLGTPDWIPLITNRSDTGIILFFETNITARPFKFYRAILLQ
ncbi:MAG: lamin tail domain-containing protein [Verrucomicrobiia bacterium]